MQRGRLFDLLATGDLALAAGQAALSAAQTAWRNDLRRAGLWDAMIRSAAGDDADPFANHTGAKAVAQAFVDHIVPVLSEYPLGQVPVRAGHDMRTSSLLLAQEGRALFSLVAREPGRHVRCAVGFDGTIRRELVLAGKGAGRLVTRRDTALRFETCALEPPAAFLLDPPRALLVDEVETRLVSLRLDLLPVTPAPAREYSLETGEFLHQSASDAQESRLELALAILGRMRRGDAVPLMVEFTRAGSNHLRWQALRECIALDTAVGVAALRTIAADAADALHRPANALLDQLCATHPQLAMPEAS